jgi:hypothetical protein
MSLSQNALSNRCSVSPDVDSRMDHSVLSQLHILCFRQAKHVEKLTVALSWTAVLQSLGLIHP